MPTEAKRGLSECFSELTALLVSAVLNAGGIILGGNLSWSHTGESPLATFHWTLEPPHLLRHQATPLSPHLGS